MLEHGGRLHAASVRYGIAESDWLDLSTGINPQGWPVPLVPQQSWQRLPQDDDALEVAARAYYGTQNLLPVAGSQAAIQTLPQLRALARVAVLEHSYAEHAHAWQRCGHQVSRVSEAQILNSAASFDVVLIVNPNNPTGKLYTTEQLLALHAKLAARGGWLVVDEAFMDATPEHSLAAHSPREGLIVLRSLGKFFGLAGARVGFVLAEPSVLEQLNERLGPWTIAAPSRYVATLALRDVAWQQAMRRKLPVASQRLAELLRNAGLPAAGGSTLFQFVRSGNAQQIHQQLAQQGILTRLFASPSSLRFGLPGDEADWQRLEVALREIHTHSRNASTPEKAAAGAFSLMVQGTTSDAGKSTLVAALCRWLLRQGVKVAPFKPQNMALNSAVTAEGGEIGRAQAVQAQACKLAPHTDMNPVLLKPNSDTGAQVIIHGRAIANMDAAKYHDYKRTAMTAVLESHARLTQQYEVVVVEGAGSPAEINLRENDIANMGFAEAVDCPVILVADIDKGGVFAHLVGTLELLSASEQARVAGFVINRFRGDIALLQPGLDWLQQRTGKPVLGVLPYLHDFHLEAEDAVPQSLPPPCPRKEEAVVVEPLKRQQPRTRGRAGERVEAGGRLLRVIVPRLPHISNHTDFDPLRLHPQVHFDFVAMGAEIPAADLIILPGSKSVRSDLAALRNAGWEDAIKHHLRYGGKVIGICGGLQMLGQQIHDPLAIEGDAGSSPGLGLLDFETTLAAEKQLRNVSGTLLLEDAAVSGYEIHAGVSTGPALQCPAVRLDSGVSDGALSSDGQLLATYLHGLFESRAACDALLRWAGLQHAQTPDYRARCESELERLADTVEQHLDGKQLRSLFGLENDAVSPAVRGELVEPLPLNESSSTGSGRTEINHA